MSIDISFVVSNKVRRIGMKFVENAALLGLGLIRGNTAYWALCAVCRTPMLRSRGLTSEVQHLCL